MFYGYLKFRPKRSERDLPLVLEPAFRLKWDDLTRVLASPFGKLLKALRKQS